MASRCGREPSRFLLELPQDDLEWENQKKVTAEERSRRGRLVSPTCGPCSRRIEVGRFGLRSLTQQRGNIGSRQRGEICGAPARGRSQAR